MVMLIGEYKRQIKCYEMWLTFAQKCRAKRMASNPENCTYLDALKEIYKEVLARRKKEK